MVNSTINTKGGMPVTTRSQSKKNTNISNDSPSPPPSSSVNTPKSNIKNKKPKQYDRMKCEQFINNPLINPFTDKEIAFLGPKFNEINSMCKELYGISYDMNKHVKDIFDNDILIGTLFRDSIKYPQPSDNKKVARVKDIFKNRNTRTFTYIDEPNAEYLRFAMNYVNTIEYFNKINDFLFNIVKDNKEQLIDFINGIRIDFDTPGPSTRNRNYYSFIEIDTDRYFTIDNYKYRDLYQRIIDNARQNNIVKLYLDHQLSSNDTLNRLTRLKLRPYYYTLSSNEIFLDNYESFRELVVQFIMQENQDINALEKLIDICEIILERNYIDNNHGQNDVLDLTAITAELNSILDKTNAPSLKSITDISSARSSNRSKSLSYRATAHLPPLPKMTRSELLEEVLQHSKEDMDVITLRKFDKMKKKDLQLIVRIGPKTRENRQSSYNVVSIYKKLHEDSKNSLAPTDPLNPGHTVTDEEMRDIHAKMQYYRRGAPRPDDLKRYEYPKVELLFESMNKTIEYILEENNIQTKTEPFYAIVIRHIIGNRANDTIWGYIPDIEVDNRPDLNTGTIISKLRDLHDKGRLLVKNYRGENNLLQFIPRVHINKSVTYWTKEGTRHLTLTRMQEEQIRKLELMKNELDRF